MSKTNPNKKKRRQASTLILFFGEGFGEEIFLKHLRKIYSLNSGVAVTVRKGKGGCPENIVIDAIRVPGEFNKKIVLLDNDKPEAEMLKARQTAKVNKIKLIENSPCLEFLLLEILEGKPKEKASERCKKEFESKYAEKQKRSDPNKYEELFPKKLLDDKRSKIPELEKLISIMEGKNHL